MKHEPFDIAIIGAGPAGCAAAIIAADAGARVALVDEARNASRLPGETLHPGAEAIFAHLGVLAAIESVVMIRPTGIVVGWGSEPFFQSYGGNAESPWRGFQIKRSDLLAILRIRAYAAGTTVMMPACALRVEARPGDFNLVETSIGPLEARTVIDASGPVCWLSRQLGHRLERLSLPLLATYGWKKKSEAPSCENPTLTANRHGWLWWAQIDNSRCAWVHLHHEASHKKACIPSFAANEARRGAVVTWRRSGPFSGPRYFKVGDAAFRLDPASSHGVLRAMMTGVSASQAALAALDSDASRTADFNRWMQTSADIEVEKLNRLYLEIGIDMRTQ